MHQDLKVISAAPHGPAEEWRAVVGWEGLYEVSDHGRVRSLGRTVRQSTGRSWLIAGRLKALRPHRDGHMLVDLKRAGQKVTARVPRLVLEAFNGPCPPGKEACHDNGVAGDDRRGNLYWGTSSDNRRDAVRHGTARFTRDEFCKRKHRLGAPNASADQVARGRRGCYVCSLANNHVPRGLAPEQREQAVQLESDRLYAQLTAGRPLVRPRIDVDRCVELYAQGRGCHFIARIVGCTPNGVLAALHRAGVQLRPRGGRGGSRC